MKVAFFSNFLNHHQLPMCEAFLAYSEIDFKFVACNKISEERINMGYRDMNTAYDFVVRAYENEDEALQIAKDYDVVIFGAAPTKYLAVRMANKRVSFRFCERSFKRGTWRRFIPMTRKKIREGYTAYKNEPLFLLASSAFASSDLALCGFNADKCFKWGYFPEVGQKTAEELLPKKRQGDILNVLYAGRLIKLKRVIDTVKAVERIVRSGEQRIVFTIIGDGEEKTKIQKYVKNKNLEQHVKFLPFIPSDMVREYMDAADAFVIGSNFYEGWGAVVNEAMSSCCVPVVSHSVGSAAYLISNGANGLIYPLGNIKALEKCLRTLIEKDDVRASMALSAYKTVTELWCAPVAVNRFVKLCSGILSGECCGVQYETGPISRAEIIKNNWIDK